MQRSRRAVLIVFLLSACSSTWFGSTTNGYVNLDLPQISPTAKIFVVENPTAENSFFEAEVADQIRRLLAQQGYSLVTDSTKADLVVVASYGIDDPRQEGTTRAVYVPGKTTTIKSSTGLKVGSTTTEGSVATVSGSRTVYDRWLVIGAYEYGNYDENGEMVQVWLGETESTGSYGDLRYVLPYMLVPALGQFGRNTGKGMYVKIKNGDPRVEALRTRNDQVSP